MGKKSSATAAAAASAKGAPAIDIGIDEKERRQIADALSRALADTYTLYLQTHGFHWNVEGPLFSTLHQMFMEQYTEMWTALDDIAERIRALGFPAPASYAALSKLSSVPDVDDVPEAMQMVRTLVAGHETLARTTRAALRVADEADDDSSADLMTQRLQVHEKTAWMLRSMLK